jgi:hypothetical protein
LTYTYSRTYNSRIEKAATVASAAAHLKTKSDYSQSAFGESIVSQSPNKRQGEATMEPREIKGLEIAAKTKLTRKGKTNLWLVPSQAGQEEKYTVAMHGETPECTCRDFEFRNQKVQTHLCC